MERSRQESDEGRTLVCSGAGFRRNGSIFVRKSRIARLTEVLGVDVLFAFEVGDGAAQAAAEWWRVVVQAWSSR